MIKKIRRRFIAVTILSVFSTIALLTIIINGISYKNVVDRSDWTLSVLAANHGTFPESLSSVALSTPPESSAAPPSGAERRSIRSRVRVESSLPPKQTEP